MSDNAPTDPKEIGAERYRRWREKNADITQQVTAYLPKTALQRWQEAGEKSGLSMPGLMLAVLSYLDETDGEELQELAKEHGRAHGLRVRYVDLETGKVKRLSTGPYRVRGRGYR